MEFDKQKAQEILARLRRRLEPSDSHESERWDVPGLNCGLPERADGESCIGDPDIDAALDAVSLSSGMICSLPENAVSNEGAVQLLSDIAIARRQLDAAYLSVVALVDHRGAAKCAGIGAQTTAGLLKSIAGVPAGRAKADVADARALHGKAAVTGTALVPSKAATPGPLANMNQLLAAGRVSIAQVDTAVRTLTKVPEHILDSLMQPSEDASGAKAETVRQSICKYFADNAPSTSPENLRRLGHHLVEILDPDTDDHFDPDSFNRRSMTMATDITGMVYGTYQLDSVAGANLRAILDPLSAPRPLQRDDDGEVVVRDTRLPEQRRADALIELVAAASPLLSSASAPAPANADSDQPATGKPEAGQPATGQPDTELSAAEREAENKRVHRAVEKLFDLQDVPDGAETTTGIAAARQPSAASKLRPGRRPARITVITSVDKITGKDPAPSYCFQTGDVAPGALSRMACDATFERLVLDARGAVLDLGRAVRLASPAQKRAISARDKGCVFPGCDRPPSWCDVHHVQHFARGGLTDVCKMCLLCPAHHSLIHSGGWELRMIDGIPHARPEPGTIKVKVAGAVATIFDTYSGQGDWVRNSYFDRLKEAEDLARSITRRIAGAA